MVSRYAKRLTKRYVKRLMIMIMLAAVVALPLYGCGSGKSAAAPDEADQGAAQEPSADNAAEAQAPDSAPEAQEPGAGNAAEAQAPDDDAAAEVTPAFSPGEEDPEILKMISEMTTQEKLAQMMIVALRSDVSNEKTATEIDRDYAEMLTKYDFGGILLFAGNVVDPAQTVTLIRDSQEAAMKSAGGIPMFICVDQEGGSVNRVPFGTTGSGNMALAATGDTSLTE